MRSDQEVAESCMETNYFQEILTRTRLCWSWKFI